MAWGLGAVARKPLPVEGPQYMKLDFRAFVDAKWCRTII